MLINEALKLNLNYGSIHMNFDVETCKPLIPSTNWRYLHNDWHTSKGSIINKEQHESLLQALVSDQNSENQNILDNHFGLQDTFKRTINGSLQRKFGKLYSTPKPLVKMKPNKLLAAWIITSIHARRGRVVKYKSIRYKLVDDILLKRNFDSHLWKQCIKVDAIRHKYFHKATSPREKIAMPLHSVTIEHLSKSAKFNGVGKIFPYLFDLNKYTLITTIHFVIDDVEARLYLQTNGFKKFGVPYCMTLQLISKHSIDSLLQSTQTIIVYLTKTGMIGWHIKPIWGYFHFLLFLTRN